MFEYDRNVNFSCHLCRASGKKTQTSYVCKWSTTIFVFSLMIASHCVDCVAYLNIKSIFSEADLGARGFSLETVSSCMLRSSHTKDQWTIDSTHVPSKTQNRFSLICLWKYISSYSTTAQPPILFPLRLIMPFSRGDENSFLASLRLKFSVFMGQWKV